MEAIKKVSTQTIWQLLGKATTSLSSILILGIVSRKFGESLTGVYTQAVTYLSFFYLLADFGFNAYLLPHLSSESEEAIFRKLLGLRVAWGVFLVLVALAVLPLLPFSSKNFYQAVVIGSFAILGNAIFVSANLFFQKNFEYRYSILASALGSLMSLGTVIIFTQIPYPLPYLLAGQTLGWLVCGLSGLWIVSKSRKISPVFDFGFIKKTYLYTWPISLTLLLNLVYFRFDSFVLASLKSFSEVGTYNLAYSIFQTALVMPSFIMNAFYPLMIRSAREDKGLFVRQIKKASQILFLISSIGVLFTYFLSPFIINIIAGEGRFLGSVESLRILSLGFPAFFISSVLMWTLITLRAYKRVAFIYLVGLLINMFLNLLFIPEFSYISSSYITGISEYLILTLQIIILIPILRKVK